VTFTITWKDGILEAKTEGRASFEELVSMTSALLTNEKWQKDGSVLVDHSELNAESLKLGEIRALADMAVQGGEVMGHARVAHVVSGDLEFGLVRMWENFVSASLDVRVGCFRSREHAMAWLSSLS
jgi:hypothetical protein